MHRVPSPVLGHGRRGQLRGRSICGQNQNETKTNEKKQEEEEVEEEEEVVELRCVSVDQVDGGWGVRPHFHPQRGRRFRARRRRRIAEVGRFLDRRRDPFRPFRRWNRMNETVEDLGGGGSRGEERVRKRCAKRQNQIKEEEEKKKKKRRATDLGRR